MSIRNFKKKNCQSFLCHRREKWKLVFLFLSRLNALFRSFEHLGSSRMSLLSPANSKHSADGRLGSFTPLHLGSGREGESGTPSRHKIGTATAVKPNALIPIAPKWTLSRPYLTLGHLSEPRGSFDFDDTQQQALGTFPLDIQEILVANHNIITQDILFRILRGRMLMLIRL